MQDWDQALRMAAERGQVDPARAEAARRALAAGRPPSQALEEGALSAAERELVTQAVHASGSSSRARGPSRFGDYLLEHELGRGGAGRVVAARHVADGRPVALKLLHSGGNEAARRRFLREAEALQRFEHPGLVRVFASGEVQGTLFLAMERLPGGTLADRLATLEPRQGAALVRSLAVALGEAHRAGIVHRDVKPENVLLRADGTPVLCDFGLARDLATDSSLTRTGVLLGTPLYMSPEQVRGETPTPRSDVYALGAVLCEVLTGGPPYPIESLPDLVRTHARATEPPRPGPLRGPVPAGLVEVCRRCLHPDPAQRYADGAALARALEEALAGAVPGSAGLAAPAAGLVLVGGALLAGAILLRGAGEPAPGLPPPSGPTAASSSTAAPPPAASAQVQELVLQPGPVLGQDTFVHSDGLYLNDNEGGDPAVRVGFRADQPGKYMTLIRFELEGRLPAGAELLEARLELQQGGALYGDGPVSLSVWPVADCPPLTPWVEGAGGSDAFLDGVAWDGDFVAPGHEDDIRVRSRRPEFTRPGLDATDGPVCELALGPVEEGRWVSFPLTPLVAAWLSGARPNLGLALRRDEVGEPAAGIRSFASSDHPDPTRRPRLVLRYRGAPPPPGPDERALEEDAARRAEVLLAPVLASFPHEGPPPSSARDTIQAALTAAPFLGLTYTLRGLLRSQAGDVSGGAFDLLRGLATSRPCRDRELLIQALVLLLPERRQELIRRELPKLLEQAPDDPELVALQADGLRQEGALDEAQALLLPRLADPEPHWRVAAAQALLLIARRRLDEALPILGRGQPPPGDKAVFDPEAMLRYGAFLHTRGDERGLEVLRRACAMSRHNPRWARQALGVMEQLGEAEAVRSLRELGARRWPYDPTWR